MRCHSWRVLLLDAQLSTIHSQLVKWVVFLRGVNVGGANRCKPAQLAKQLKKFDLVNIGAVGTFVVRENVSESTLRAAIAKKLSFECEIMIVPAKAIVDLVRHGTDSPWRACASCSCWLSSLAS